MVHYERLPELSDTIAALSSPPGIGWRHIVRLTGPNALQACERILHPEDVPRLLTSPARRRLSVRLELPRWPRDVRAAIYCMPGPHSYTRQDLVELHVTGSLWLARSLLNSLLRGAVRLAGPGEFTQRAYLNGRLPLAQAEAVMAIVESRSRDELEAAVRWLRGDSGRETHRLVQGLADLCSLIEADLDFSDQDIEPSSPQAIQEQLCRLRASLVQLKKWASCCQAGRLRPRILLRGRANVGKSSLFCRLTSHPTLITELPGTTRDLIEAPLRLDELDADLIDSAGWYAGSSEVDSLAAELAAMEEKQAELILAVLDRSSPLEDEDRELLRKFPERLAIAVNKSDLPPRWKRDDIAALAREASCVEVSARTGEGLEALRRALAAALLTVSHPGRVSKDSALARRQEAFCGCLERLEGAIQALETDIGLEFVAADVRQALNTLSEITGEVTADDILGRIFARFCIGK